VSTARSTTAAEFDALFDFVNIVSLILLLGILPGAAVAVVLWTVAASLFSWYLANLGRFTVTYGSLGGIVLSLFFFYGSAAIFIFGAEINAAIRRLAARAAARTLAEPGAGR
jgi:membrane protein